jgi:hypothetical protein
MGRCALGVIFASALVPGCSDTGGQVEETGVGTSASTGAVDVSPDPNGTVGTLTTAGTIDRSNPFFVALGFNGRTCESCHKESDGWSISASHARAIFDATGGNDPLFTTNDGSLCPSGDVSTVDARRTLFGLLLNRGLIRIPLSIPPAAAEFDLVSADTFPCPDARRGQLNLFRRPLPATNLAFVPSIMWDGREASLGTQALGATLGHAQGSVPLPAGAIDAIVAFESALFTAQATTTHAGALDASGASGGPTPLSLVSFSVGENPGGGNSSVFSLFSAWENASSAARAQIARGEKIFNEKTFVANGVGGAPSPSFGARCSTCHNAFDAGSDSLVEFLDIGTADGGARRPPDLPMYTLRNRATRALLQTTDPGRAMITGKWADIGRFKVPGLRGLAARAPYFHNGLAPNLDAVVDFYDQRFSIGFTPQEHADLVAFLGAL